WDWKELSNNEALPWSLELIERFDDKWDWERLSNNEALPWSLELIERFEDKWRWSGGISLDLSYNEAVPWSLELIERFKDKWDWRFFNQKATDCLPKLSLEDIDEVMSYHFPLTQISKQSNDFDDDLPF
ncbi:MAG TPA: hypothetical protein PKU92_11355, partial [Agitococcus sp.]|nr:hypothetical protein [Agitococcus sp.]